ncbi:MAG: GNAT family N-acetyltransferase [Clostridiaceae bacterium]|jgi:ribosomal-protein-alanine acetyltransferase|nr:GNAT family N-acetyltransferase [Clostridiaceae bacterium]
MNVSSNGIRINNRSIYVRDARIDDLDDVAMIEAQSFTSPWSRDALELFFVTDNQDRFLLVAEVKTELKSYPLNKSAFELRAVLEENYSYPDEVTKTNPESCALVRSKLSQHDVAGADQKSQEMSGASSLLGFIAVQVLVDVFEIQRIAVLPDVRNLGIGALLMTEVMRRGKAMEAASIMLEVSEGNSHARRLYSAFGFKVVGRRKSYYADTGEDAVLMTATPPFLLTKTSDI